MSGRLSGETAVGGRRVRRRACARLAAITVLALLPARAVADATTPDGALDPTFGNGGLVTTAAGTQAVAGAAVVQPDGRIVTAGETQDGTGGAMMISARVNPDGTPDQGYGTDGVVLVDIDRSAVANTLALQPDGRIVLVGAGKDPSTKALMFSAVRLLADGTRDASFGTDGVVTVPIGRMSIANAVAVQPDGRIVLAGGAIDGSAVGATLLGTGALAFGSAGFGNTPVGSGIGSSALTGTTFAAGTVFAATRLLPDGKVDPSFGTGGVVKVAKPTGEAWGLALQPDGRIVLGGGADDGGTVVYAAARLTPDGALDDGFGDHGIVRTPIGQKAFGDAVALRPDGRILVAGSAFTDRLVAAAVSLLPDGRPDPAFGQAGTALLELPEGINAASLQPDGKVLLAATGATAVRLNVDGSPDPEFGSDGVAAARFGGGAANGVTTQHDGAIVLSGVVAVGGHPELSIIRLRSRAPVVAARRSATHLVLRTCHGHAACSTNRVPGPVRFRRHGVAHASLVRHGVVYAVGRVRAPLLTLVTRRVVPRGPYTLLLRYEGSPRMTSHQVVRVR